MATDIIIQDKLLSWCNWHAASMLFGSGMLLFFDFPIGLLLFMAIISFSILVYSGHGFWTPGLRFGIANGVTLLRLLLVLLLAVLGTDQSLFIILLSTLVFCLDGVDGWLARKFTCTSEFGEYFDKETDAFFMLLLCWLLYLDQRLGMWILFPGLMRYFFVLFLMLVSPPHYKEPQTTTGKYIFAVTVIILIFCFTGYRQLYQPLAMLMTLLLMYSFADTIHLIYQSGKHENKT